VERVKAAFWHSRPESANRPARLKDGWRLPITFGMRERGWLTVGRGVASLGAAVTIGSLFMSWYGLSLPDEATSELGPLVVSSLQEGARRDAWQIFEQTDVALLCLSMAVLIIALMPGTSAATRLIGWAGLAATALVVWHLIDQPGPNLLVSIEPGAWLALAGTLAMAAGGAGAVQLTAGPQWTPRPWPESPPVTPGPSTPGQTSSPPPGAW